MRPILTLVDANPSVAYDPDEDEEVMRQVRAFVLAELREIVAARRAKEQRP